MSTFTAPTTTGTTRTSSRSRRRVGVAATAAALLAAGLLGQPFGTGTSHQSPAQWPAIARDAAVKADRLQAQLDTVSGPTSQQEALAQAMTVRRDRLQAQLDARVSR
jgi:hypothetical protein